MRLFVLLLVFVSLSSCLLKSYQSYLFCKWFQDHKYIKLYVQPHLIWDLQGSTNIRKPSSFNDPRITLKELRNEGKLLDVAEYFNTGQVPIRAQTRQQYVMPLQIVKALEYQMSSDGAVINLLKQLPPQFTNSTVAVLVLAINENSNLAILKDEELLEKIPAITVFEYTKDQTLKEVWIAISRHILAENDKLHFPPMSMEFSEIYKASLYRQVDDMTFGDAANGIYYSIFMNICKESEAPLILTTTSTPSTSSSTPSTSSSTSTTSSSTPSTSSSTSTTTETTKIIPFSFWLSKQFIILLVMIFLTLLIVIVVTMLLYSVTILFREDASPIIAAPPLIKGIEAKRTLDVDSDDWVDQASRP